MDTERLLTPKEVARILGVSRKTVLRWIAAGHIRYIHVGQTVRIPASEILAQRDKRGQRRTSEDNGDM